KPDHHRRRGRPCRGRVRGHRHPHGHGHRRAGHRSGRGRTVTDERYVVLGLAHVRSSWFNDVARWSTVGSLPIEFVKCLGAEELRSRLRGGRAFSAALLDARLPAVDRDLLAALADAGVPSLVVDATADHRDWVSLGAAGRLAEPLERAPLLDALVVHGRMIGPVAEVTSGLSSPPAGSAMWRGRLVTVTGTPGSGTSTIAASIAQGLGADPRYRGDV